MKKLVFGLLTALILAIPAHATKFVASKGEDYVVADNEVACPADIDKLLHEQHKIPETIHFFSARAHVDGKDYRACWTQIGDNAVLVYEDGDVGYIPTGQFRTLHDV